VRCGAVEMGDENLVEGVGCGEYIAGLGLGVVAWWGREREREGSNRLPWFFFVLVLIFFG